MKIVIISSVISLVVSVITTKIMATHYYKIVDDHVNEMCNMTKKFVGQSLSTLRKNKQNSDPME